MGRGNYCPIGDVSDQWYIDYDNYRWEDEEHDEYEIDTDLIEEDTQCVMKQIQRRFPSFHTINEWGDGYWGEIYKLENKYFIIGMADNQWSYAVFIMMKRNLLPEEENLAMRHYFNYRDKIEQILLNTFGTIYRRDGPWMSTKLERDAGVQKGA